MYLSEATAEYKSNVDYNIDDLSGHFVVISFRSQKSIMDFVENLNNLQVKCMSHKELHYTDESIFLIKLQYPSKHLLEIALKEIRGIKTLADDILLSNSNRLNYKLWIDRNALGIISINCFENLACESEAKEIAASALSAERLNFSMIDGTASYHLKEWKQEWEKYILQHWDVDSYVVDELLNSVAEHVDQVSLTPLTNGFRHTNLKVIKNIMAAYLKVNTRQKGKRTTDIENLSITRANHDNSFLFIEALKEKENSALTDIFNMKKVKYDFYPKSYEKLTEEFDVFLSEGYVLTAFRPELSDFKSELPRESVRNEISRNLSMGHIIHSDIYQGTKPVHSLINAIISDYLECITANQNRVFYNSFIEIAKNIETFVPTPEVLGKLFKSGAVEAAKEWNPEKFKKQSFGK